MINKICTCICCCECACCVGECIDQWHSIEACGFAYLECGNCCWTVFAPICHSCSLGDCGAGMAHCVSGLKYCLYSCALSFCSPIDGLINCVLYSKDIFTDGLNGSSGMLKNTQFVSSKIRDGFGFSTSPEPMGKFSAYSP